jgi:hypothetical protein
LDDRVGRIVSGARGGRIVSGARGGRIVSGARVEAARSSRASQSAAASPMASRSSESSMASSCRLSGAGSAALRYTGESAAVSRVGAAISFTRKRTVPTWIPAAFSRATISLTSNDSSCAQLAEATWTVSSRPRLAPGSVRAAIRSPTTRRHCSRSTAVPA